MTPGLKEELKELRQTASNLEYDLDRIKSLVTELQCTLSQLTDVLDGIENTVEEEEKEFKELERCTKSDSDYFKCGFEAGHDGPCGIVWKIKGE